MHGHAEIDNSFKRAIEKKNYSTTAAMINESASVAKRYFEETTVVNFSQGAISYHLHTGKCESELRGTPLTS